MIVKKRSERCLANLSARRLGVLFVLFLCASLCADDFGARRAQLMSAHSDGLIILQAGPEAPPHSENGSRQDSNFYYLTGLDTGGAVLVLDAPKKESWLFVREKPSELSGVDHVAPPADLSSFVRRRLKESARYLYDAGTARKNSLLPQVPAAKWRSAAASLEKLRWTKSPSEATALRRVGWASTAAMRAAMRAVGPARTPREAEAEAARSCVWNGGEGPSFRPEVLSGPNSADPAAVHPARNDNLDDRAMKAGELVYLDLGCARDHYEGDLGRTVPVSGKFTPEQREVWDVLVRAFQAARATVRPGASARDLREAYIKVFREAPVKSDLAREALEAVTKEGGAGETLQVHGVGLDWWEKPQEQFQPGVAFTMDATLILPKRNRGMHLADMFLVTESGTELLTAGLPYAAEEVEAFLALPAAMQALYTTADAHAHMDPPPRHSPESMIRQMNVLGLAQTIIFRGHDREDPEFVVKAAARYPDRLIPFYRPTVHEDTEAWLRNDPKVLEDLEKRLASGNYYGIGEVNNVRLPLPPDRGKELLATEVSPLAPVMVGMFRLAEKYNVPVSIHNEVYYYKELLQLVKQFPRVRVIWCHGSYANAYGVEMALMQYPNLYVDLAGRFLYGPQDLVDSSIFYTENTVKPSWIRIIEKYPEHFVIGFDDNSTQYVGKPEAFGWAARLLSQLRPSTARRVAIENIESLLAASGK